MTYIPNTIWSYVINDYWKLHGVNKDGILVDMRQYIDNWIKQYGGPKTGLAMNVMAHAYPGRNQTQYINLGEAIFRNWGASGFVNASNGRDDSFQQFCYSYLFATSPIHANQHDHNGGY